MAATIMDGAALAGRIRVEVAKEVRELGRLGLATELNRDDGVDGILVQLPLPAHVDEARVLRSVDPIKDVDGFHPFNAGQLAVGSPTLVPATALGVMELLAEYAVPLQGARVVVVGRGTRSTRTCSSRRSDGRLSSRPTWSGRAPQWSTSASAAPRRASSATST